MQFYHLKLFLFLDPQKKAQILQFVCFAIPTYLPYLDITIISWKYEHQLHFYFIGIFYARVSYLYAPDNLVRYVHTDLNVGIMWMIKFRCLKCGMDENTTATTFRYRLTPLVFLSNFCTWCLTGVVRIGDWWWY